MNIEDRIIGWMSIYKEGIAFHFFVIACKVVKITTPSFHSLNQIIPIEQARAGALSKRSHSKLFQGNSKVFAKVGLNALYWFIIHSWNRTIIRLFSLVFVLIPSLASFTVCKLVTSKKKTVLKWIYRQFLFVRLIEMTAKVEYLVRSTRKKNIQSKQ